MERALSKSYIAVLQEDKKKEIADEIRRIIDSDSDKVWIDETKGTFEYPYKAHVVICYKEAGQAA